MGAFNINEYSSSDNRDLEESFARLRLRSESRKGDMKRIGRRSGGSTNAIPVRKLDRLPFPSFLGIIQDTAPRPVPTAGDVRTIIEYTTDPQLEAEVATLKARVAELEGINKELEETILEVQDVAVGKLTSLLQANEGHSDNLEQENKVQEKVKAIKDRIQRLLQQSNYDAGVASGVLQSSDEQENTCIAPTPIPLPPYDDDLRFEGGFDTRRTEMDNPKFDANEPVGMFIFKEKDERALVQDLIVNVDPSELLDSRPHGIIAYILFMCLRWADHMNNPRQLQSLLTNSISSIKHVATKNHNRVDLVSFWICNSFVLLNAMKYSEEIQDEPHEYEMENFDLAEYIIVLEDLVSQMYLAVIKNVQEKLSGMVSAAILEHDMLPNVEGSRHARKKYNAGSSKTVTDVIAVLQEVYDTLLSYGVDLHIVQQMFMQLLYFISANCLNNLLLRKDLCNWSKGLQIQYNVSQIEAWLRDHKLDVAKSKLACISQATKLLQMPKQSQDDVSKILEACTELNYMQIQKILSMYTPDTSDERVPVHVICAVESVGRKRDYKESNKKPSLMLDLTQIKQALILHVVPDQALCDVQIPEKLNVGFLRKATYIDIMED